MYTCVDDDDTSTPHALTPTHVRTLSRYVLVIKLSPTEFIQQKVQREGSEGYAIDGSDERFATLAKLIASVPEVMRPILDTAAPQTLLSLLQRALAEV